MIIATARDGLRRLRCAVEATVRQVSRRRLVATALALLALIACAAFVPLPSAMQLRDWASAAGPWFPLAFFGAHVAVTVFPFPRTAFTLAAGLLFGPLLGVGIAVLASTVSAVIALLVVRAAGWQLSGLVRHPGVDGINSRLQRRGWPVVMSLRLIPAVPFSVINYAAGASSIRVLPYTAATFVGLVPGTLAVVVLGDALTGHLSPLLLVVSMCTASVGIVGLALEMRAHRRERAAGATESAISTPTSASRL